MNSRQAMDNYLKKRSLRIIRNKVEDAKILERVSKILDTLNSRKTAKGSTNGRRAIARDAETGYQRLVNDYFADDAVFGARFRRRFRMHKELFLRITEAVKNHDDYFVQKRNAAGTLGLATLQKTTVAIRMLSYGSSADSTDEYVRIGESTAMESLKRFCVAVDEVFGAEYLRSPTEEDIKKLYQEGEERGFPGMLGSIDCMHWEWKNCPTAYHGQYKGKEGVPTMILEAVASKDLWIWHAFFGLPGTLNDINVLDRSPVFRPYENGQSPEVPFAVNSRTYEMGYYLADGIYPDFGNLVKSFKYPATAKQKVRTSRLFHFIYTEIFCYNIIELCKSTRSMQKGCGARFWCVTGSLRDHQKSCKVVGFIGPE